MGIILMMDSYCMAYILLLIGLTILEFPLYDFNCLPHPVSICECNLMIQQ